MPRCSYAMRFFACDTLVPSLPCLSFESIQSLWDLIQSVGVLDYHAEAPFTNVHATRLVRNMGPARIFRCSVLIPVHKSWRAQVPQSQYFDPVLLITDAHPIYSILVHPLTREQVSVATKYPSSLKTNFRRFCRESTIDCRIGYRCNSD